MRTVLFKLTADLTTSDRDEDGDLVEHTEHIEEELIRHVPENAFERQLYSQTITYAVWLSSGNGGSGLIPIKSFKHFTEGYAAYLDLDNSKWDENGRLGGIVRIAWSSLPRESTYREVFDLPIYYSLVSSPESNSDGIIYILYEFAPTPFSKMTQWSMGGNLKRGYFNLLPFLEVPQGHPLYQKKPVLPDDDLEDVDFDLDTSWEDGRGDSTESWLSGMSADERAATMNNLDWSE